MDHSSCAKCECWRPAATATALNVDTVLEWWFFMRAKAKRRSPERLLLPMKGRLAADRNCRLEVEVNGRARTAVVGVTAVLAVVSLIAVVPAVVAVV